jgi:RNA polymerase sigma factor (sigma-70 family)
MSPSRRLLADYVNTGSEGAFRELVERYIDLVHSVAARLVNGDVHLAQDITQKVFIDLAKLARTLPADVMLGGWLHRHVVFVAMNEMRGERRRQNREREAAAMNALEHNAHPNLAAVAPILDEAIDKLAQEDRSAILLRFFEKLDFRSVGSALGGSEEAARKRVDRALEKLHTLLTQKGIALSVSALGAALGAEAVTAAPVGLAGSIAGAALAGVSAAGTSLTVLKLMTITKLKAGLLSIVVVAGVSAPLVMQYRAQQQLREENTALRQQLNEAAAQTSTLSNQLQQTAATPAISQDQLSELLRLRGQVGALRKQLSEAAKVGSAVAAKGPGTAPADAQNAEEAMRDQFIARMTFAKSWMLAFFLYSEKNGDNFPASYGDAAPFLPEEFRDKVLASTNQFEIVYRGSIQSVKKPASTIVLRELEAAQTPDGGWARTYGFADGHSEVHKSDTGDFSQWEAERMVSTNAPAPGQ